MVLDHRVEVMLTETMDVSDELRINRDISGAMKKYFDGGVVALIGIDDYLFDIVVSKCANMRKVPITV
ncbi:hypothetical protein PanWU01x14_095950 [Parasponia andersonii]|uniref:Uncharacterized protein n=1 Tax=Parasponia andersonii TaxID=3476 RepID=A0A2P5D561_PARAD|nr:hypothetical protein PanWU01x14_095950 [Parasponia andersonii]